MDDASSNETEDEIPKNQWKDYVSTDDVTIYVEASSTSNV